MDFLKEIKKYNLRPSVERNLPLFLNSCVGWGYTDFLKENYGLSFKVYGSLGRENYFNSLVNQNFFAKPLNEIYQNRQKFYALRKKALDYFKEFRLKYRQLRNVNDLVYFKFLTENYPVYFSALGFYNCLWRFFGHKKVHSRLLKNLSAERTLLAAFYPQVESDFKKRAIIIGRQKKFPGDLVRYLTRTEMNSFLINGRLTSPKILELKRRLKNYTYLHLNHSEYVTSNQAVFNRLKKEFSHRQNPSLIKGFAVYPGKTRGIVNKGGRASGKGDILVVSMTHPEDNSVLKKYSAIVTNEGGVLTHAAIVARELKIPCITGTKIATQALQDGDFVEVDADKGIVRKIKK